MKRLTFLALLLAAGFPCHAENPAVPVALAAEKGAPIKALMVCGGCCHDYTAQKRILSEGISARANVTWTIVQEGIPSPGDDGRKTRVSIYEKPNWWAGYDVIVHNECFGYVDDNAFVEGIAAAHKAGVPGLMLHCSSHSYRMATTDEWRMAVGITSRSHEAKRDLTVKVIKADHPVMKGFPAEWLDKGDELYKNEKVWPTATPLAQAYGQDTKQDHVCIWLNQYGNARIFSTTLGHSNETMSSEEYLGFVTRGLLWACDKLKDDGTPKDGFGK
jgi:type 1 glutamine amidotransferase